LAPVVAGLAIAISGSSLFDAVVALIIAAVILTTTFQAVIGSHKELLGQRRSCADTDGNQYKLGEWEIGKG